jgi:L-fuconolactonase
MPDEFIDAHHHLWKYSQEQYPWMLDGMEGIRQNFLIPELQKAARDAGISGTVAVQARQTIEETKWLLGLAGSSDLIRGVVGWVPLVDADVAKQLEAFAAEAKLKGVRHVLHDEPDDFYMLRDDFNRGVSRLKDFGLQYDILIFERHLSQTIQFVDRHPNQRFVVDHIAKPRVKAQVRSPWQELITELARRENVCCKLSGMATEADWRQWTESDLRPYFDITLDAFGPKRLMFGSDWPVILVACDYKRWAQMVRSWISEMSAAEQAFIMGGTAKLAYSL